MPKSPAVELSQAELELKRRGRRRLIGAVTIGLVAIVVLPMVFDNEPRRAAQDATTKRQEIAINIPAREGQPPLVAPSAAPVGDAKAKPAPAVGPETTPPAATPATAPEPKKPEPAVAEKPTSAAKPAPTSAATPPAAPAQTPAKAPAKEPAKESAPAPAAAATKGQFVIQIGAFKDAENAKSVVARIKDVKLPVFTDSVAVKTGTVTRVRVGPFATREKADGALAEVKLAGIDGKVVPAQ